MGARSPEVAQLISLGPPQLPLSQAELKVSKECGTPRVQDLNKLFAGARSPLAAAAGLLLRIGCWEQSHTVAQDIAVCEGSYWHGILHRIEPDSSNAQYWFRRLGPHPIFPELLDRTTPILKSGPKHWKMTSRWDPMRFVEWCDEGRESGGPAKETATAIQMLEWQLLFDWCAGEVA